MSPIGSSRRRIPWIRFGLSAILAVAALGSSQTATAASVSKPTAFSNPAAAPRPLMAKPGATSTLATVLASLRVAPERRTGYTRTLFRLWIDADHNGCNTRQEVLIAEAITAPKVLAKCVLSGGRWLSRYDGLTFSAAGKLDIDHVVPLAEAWDSGAWAWTPARRQAYANDLGVPWSLIAVSATSNRAKGDQDPAEWLPPLSTYRCRYLADWVAIKARWGLSVDSKEKSAIAAFTACRATPVRVVVVH
jgi:hypothetical protein